MYYYPKMPLKTFTFVGTNSSFKEHLDLLLTCILGDLLAFTVNY